ncbi:hypothetical protein ScPMuIL_001020 [Solemya velum]
MAKVVGFPRYLSKTFLLQREIFQSGQPIRYRWKWVNRGKPASEARTLAQRKAELETKDPVLDREINIGYPLRLLKKNSRQRNRTWQEARKEKEQESRHRQLKVPLESIRTAWENEMGVLKTRVIAEHYGIYRDLFDNAFFYLGVPLHINYDFDDEFVTPVYTGNRILPSEAATVPHVEYPADKGSLWTLMMTAPDSHLQDSNSEYLHWLVSNIPECSVEKGDVLCDYMQPFPVKRTGFSRYVFVLFKQKGKIDLGEEKRPADCTSLEERNFKTLEFYRKHQDDLTPSGLSFFQSEWEESVTEFFWTKLDMKEPEYEFMHPPPYHPEQRKYPHKNPFNLYLDRYRDTKDINEEVLREKLKNTHPFREPTTLPKYPNIYNIPPTVPTWLKQKIHNMRLRRHQWKDLD